MPSWQWAWGDLLSGFALAFQAAEVRIAGAAANSKLCQPLGCSESSGKGDLFLLHLPFVLP